MTVEVVGTVLQKTECRCGSILQYHPRDMQHRASLELTGPGDWIITCPTCDEKVVVGHDEDR